MPDAGRAPASNEPDVGDVVVTVADVLAAQARLRRYLPTTPLHLAERFGVMLKLENLQRTGSYKVRGALNALLAARERGDRRPVIAASAGNHAQGLAWAAYRLGVQRARADVRLARADRFSDIYLVYQPYTLQGGRAFGLKGTYSYAIGVNAGQAAVVCLVQGFGTRGDHGALGALGDTDHDRVGPKAGRRGGAESQSSHGGEFSLPM